MYNALMTLIMAMMSVVVLGTIIIAWYNATVSPQ